jgi:hypothetical protein
MADRSQGRNTISSCRVADAAKLPICKRGLSGSAGHDPIYHCVPYAGRQYGRDACSRPWPGRAVSIHAAAADRAIARVTAAELPVDPRCGAAGTGAATFAHRSLPRDAVGRFVGGAIGRLREHQSRTRDRRAVVAWTEYVRGSRLELRTRRCGRRFGAQSVGRIHGAMRELARTPTGRASASRKAALPGARIILRQPV